MATIGILALQGCVEPHAEHLRRLGVEARLVRQRKHLGGIQGIILPGGESTTMLKLAHQFGLWEELRELGGKIPFWGVCAGAILMAKQVENPRQESLGTIDLHVRRNAYGRQVDSFQQEIELGGAVETAVFIRAPKFVSWGKGVAVAGRVSGEAVFLESGRHMVTAFHPELSESPWCHERFLRGVE
jgi:5'-phosphate synthase pdxT subunit